MRTDMAKVLVERPRRGGQCSRKGRHSALGLLPTKEGMRRWWTDRKELNENLAPLCRFLASRVGRRWDAVYAEICAHLSASNAVQLHVRSHLADYVALKLHVHAEGRLEGHSWHGRDWRHSYDFYVDPRDGVLKRSLSDKARRREAQRRQQRLAAQRVNAGTIVTGPMSELHRLNGVWYSIEFAPLPQLEGSFHTEAHAAAGRTAPQRGMYDVLRRAYVMTGVRYAATKRQLTTQELRQRGLWNILA
jgi:hypothetical protein